MLVLDIQSCCSDSPDVITEIPCYISVVCALITWDNHLWVTCSNKPFHWLVPGALDLIARKLGHPWSVLMLSGPMWGESWWVPANSQRIDIKAAGTGKILNIFDPFWFRELIKRVFSLVCIKLKGVNEEHPLYILKFPRQPLRKYTILWLTWNRYNRAMTVCYISWQ